MSTSLLYHGFGVRGYKYQSTEYKEGMAFFTVTQDRLSLRCSQCNSRDVICKGTNDRELRAVPIGGKKVYIHIAVQRILCLCCGLLRLTEDIGNLDTVRRPHKSKGYEL
jgi:transposase